MENDFKVSKIRQIEKRHNFLATIFLVRQILLFQLNCYWLKT